jgi:hypothetical protein
VSRHFKHVLLVKIIYGISDLFPSAQIKSLFLQLKLYFEIASTVQWFSPHILKWFLICSNCDNWRSLAAGIGHKDPYEARIFSNKGSFELLLEHMREIESENCFKIHVH